MVNEQKLKNCINGIRLKSRKTKNLQHFHDSGCFATYYLLVDKVIDLHPSKVTQKHTHSHFKGRLKHSQTMWTLDIFRSDGIFMSSKNCLLANFCFQEAALLRSLQLHTMSVEYVYPQPSCSLLSMAGRKSKNTPVQ